MAVLPLDVWGEIASYGERGILGAILSMTVPGLAHLGPPRPYPDPDDLRRKWTYWFAQHRPWAELKPLILRKPGMRQLLLYPAAP